jgi:uncharacterized protein
VTEAAAAAAAGVTVVITRRVRPGHEAAYEAALAGLQADGTQFDGYLGATTQRPAAGAAESGAGRPGDIP